MDRDLLPWILGGALVTTGAIAGVIRYSAQHSAALAVMRTAPASNPGSAASAAAGAPPSPAAPSPSAVSPATASIAPSPAPGAGEAPDPAAQPRLVPRPDTAASSPSLPAGEVWQCTVNGQKVFSDTRCGSGASVKQLGDLNVMDVPPPQYPMAYGQRYMPYPSAAPYPSPAPYPDEDADAGDVSSEAYPSEIIVARERARRQHRIHQGLPSRSPPPAPAPYHGGAGARSTR